MKISRKILSMIGLGLILLGTLIAGIVQMGYRANADDARDRIEQLTNENTALSKKNNSLIQEVRNLNTGGDGFLDLRNSSVTLYPENIQKKGFILDLTIPIFNKGDYPFDNIKIKTFEVKDYLNSDPIFLWTDLSSSGLNINSRFPSINNAINYESKAYLPELDYEAQVFKPNQSITLNPIRFKEDFEYYGVNIFIESRRQDWLLLIRFQRPEDKTLPFVNQIYRIFKITNEGLENIYKTESTSFPKFENGKTKWFKNEIPEIWFKKQ